MNREFEMLYNRDYPQGKGAATISSLATNSDVTVDVQLKLAADKTMVYDPNNVNTSEHTFSLSYLGELKQPSYLEPPFSLCNSMPVAAKAGHSVMSPPSTVLSGKNLIKESQLFSH